MGKQFMIDISKEPPTQKEIEVEARRWKWSHNAWLLVFAIMMAVGVFKFATATDRSGLLWLFLAIQGGIFILALCHYPPSLLSPVGREELSVLTRRIRLLESRTNLDRTNLDQVKHYLAKVLNEPRELTWPEYDLCKELLAPLITARTVDELYESLS